MRFVAYCIPRGPLAVAIDDDCGLCRATWAALAPLLPADTGVTRDSARTPRHPLLQAVPPATRLEALHAATDTEVWVGFRAVSALVRRTLVGPVLAPLMAVLEFTPVGEALYRVIARNRSRSCRLPKQR